MTNPDSPAERGGSRGVWDDREKRRVQRFWRYPAWARRLIIARDHGFRITRMRIGIAWNALKLAPDRYLTVFGVIAIFGLALTEIELPDDAPGVQTLRAMLLAHPSIAWLHSMQDLPEGAAEVVVLVLVLFVSWPLTYKLSKRDADLFARVLTENVDTVHSMYYLSALASQVSRRVWKNKRVNLKDLERSRSTLQTIETTKEILARRLELAPRVFCDQFLQFSPSIFADRVTKLGLNARFLRKSEIKSTDYRRALRHQSGTIEHGIEMSSRHLKDLRKTRLDFAQIEALFLSGSTSASIQRLAYILQNSKPTLRDLRLLYRLLGAYRGRSLFRRLMAVTVASTIHDLDKPDDDVFRTPKPGAEDLLQTMETRVRLLLLAETEDDSPPAEAPPGTPTASEELERIYRSNEHLALWWEDVSRYLFRTRQDLIADLYEQHLARLTPDHTGYLYVIVDSYSRAVRTALRAASDKAGRIRFFFLTDQSVNNDQSKGARLIRHITRHENWSTSGQKVEIFSGNLDLLKSLLDPLDCGVFLTGASAIIDRHHIYTTTNPALVEALESTFNSGDPRRFHRIALAGMYKLEWKWFHADILRGWYGNPEPAAPDVRRDVVARLEKAGVNETSLLQARDSLTGGLYRLRVDTLRTNVHWHMSGVAPSEGPDGAGTTGPDRDD